jgi:hypothetical protein
MEDFQKEMQKKDEKISEQMQEGFEITSDAMSIRKIFNAIQDGSIHDAPYQRETVWDNARKKALVETIMKYGGKKIPTVTLRKLNDGTMEIVDGKQRLLSAIYPFVQNEFSLNGVSIPELTGYKINDIKQDFPLTYSAFMTTEIPVQVLSNMSNDEAIVYFIQVNSSGVQMNCGEKIHAMQETPILKVIDSLINHKVWDNVTYVRRHNNYEYVAKMLLYVRDTDVRQGIYNADNKHKLLNQLDVYRSTKVPSEMVESVKETLDFLEKVFRKYEFKLTIREFYNVFTYSYVNLDLLGVSDFGKFIRDLYYFIHELTEKDGMNMCRVIKNKHMEKGFGYTSEYYKWYNKTLNKMFAQFVRGEDWNEIKRVSNK